MSSNKKDKEPRVQKLPEIDPKFLTWYVHCINRNSNTGEYASKTFGPVASMAAAIQIQTIHEAQKNYASCIVNQNPNPPGF